MANILHQRHQRPRQQYLRSRQRNYGRKLEQRNCRVILPAISSASRTSATVTAAASSDLTSQTTHAECTHLQKSKLKRILCGIISPIVRPLSYLLNEWVVNKSKYQCYICPIPKIYELDLKYFFLI